MNSIKNIAEIEDFHPIARSFAELLVNRDNADIGLEFPATAARYTGDISAIVSRLREAQTDCVPGTRQQFIAFAGENAVGMSVIRFADELPKVIGQNCPNLSGFVCHPYRNRGIGRLSLIERLRVVDEQFDGYAWTKVSKVNEYSNRMVACAGLVLAGEDIDNFVYSYKA
jgi:hypothetical protein